MFCLMLHKDVLSPFLHEHGSLVFFLYMKARISLRFTCARLYAKHAYRKPDKKLMQQGIWEYIFFCMLSVCFHTEQKKNRVSA